MQSENDLRDFRDLMKRVANGSEQAASEVVARFNDVLRRAIRRAMSRPLRHMFDSADFAQVTWLSFFAHAERAARLHRPQQLLGYLIRIAKRNIATKVRDRLLTEKHNLRRECSLEEWLEKGAELADGQPDAIEFLIQQERWDRIFSGHAERDREIIRLRLQGLNDQQIADSLGIAIKTVRRFWKKLLG